MASLEQWSSIQSLVNLQAEIRTMWVKNTYKYKVARQYTLPSSLLALTVYCRAGKIKGIQFSWMGDILLVVNCEKIKIGPIESPSWLFSNFTYHWVPQSCGEIDYVLFHVLCSIRSETHHQRVNYLCTVHTCGDVATRSQLTLISKISHQRPKSLACCQCSTCQWCLSPAPW